MSGLVQQFEIRIDGRPLMVDAGCTLAAALMNAGIEVLRHSVSAESRGALCAMGVCHECRMTVDGVAHRRACMVVVTPGMVVERSGTHA
jgi:predicted molibdopterin-dependent oxidoreductase YjgC